MRLDRFLSEMGVASRTESKKAAKAGSITLNGIPVYQTDIHINPLTDRVTFEDAPVFYEQYTYIMLNKPKGYISATDDRKKQTVLDLLPPRLQARGLFPCGRLDIDTTGLLILTNDGALSHALLSPKHHAEKTYRFTTDIRLPDTASEAMAKGITLSDGYVCLPAKLVLDKEGNGGIITITEGKFHQIKRMTEALGAGVLSLSRISFAGVTLDASLSAGQWRQLNEEEIAMLEKYRI